MYLCRHETSLTGQDKSPGLEARLLQQWLGKCRRIPRVGNCGDQNLSFQARPSSEGHESPPNNNNVSSIWLMDYNLEPRSWCACTTLRVLPAASHGRPRRQLLSIPTIQALPTRSTPCRSTCINICTYFHCTCQFHHPHERQRRNKPSWGRKVQSNFENTKIS